MDILKIATAGSVDDGKSTLIGRLMYDTNSIAKDKLQAVEASSLRKGLDFVDLSLLTDGLIAEREQGITIDVAHIYFSTPNRNYIIADTPGHVEYTRNMITGASQADASIILIDARKGVLEQTKRHIFIFSLLRISTLIICINKMDLVAYDEALFNTIVTEVKSLVGKMGFEGDVHFVPIAAKDGDNVVERSVEMNWYTGNTLLEYLESLPVHVKDETLPPRFPVQYVIRPHTDQHHDFRGYSGKIESGTFNKGDQVVVLPSGKTSHIKSIHTGSEEVNIGKAGESIVMQLDDEIDISRGNMIVPKDSLYQQVNAFTATICWMDTEPLSHGSTYLLQHGVHIVKAKITNVISMLNIADMEEIQGKVDFHLNDIGKISLKTAKPIFADTYILNPRNGAFILINEFTNSTVAVGFIDSFLK